MPDLKRDFAISLNGKFFHFHGQGRLYGSPIAVFSRTVEHPPELMINLLSMQEGGILTITPLYEIDPETIFWLKGRGGYRIKEGHTWPAKRMTKDDRKTEVVELVPALIDDVSMIDGVLTTPPPAFTAGSAIAGLKQFLGYAEPAMRGEDFVSPFMPHGSEDAPVFLDAFSIDITQIFPSNLPEEFSLKMDGVPTGTNHELLNYFRATSTAASRLPAERVSLALDRIYRGYDTDMSREQPELVKKMKIYGESFPYGASTFTLLAAEKHDCFALAADDQSTNLLLEPGRAIISFYGYVKGGETTFTGASMLYAINNTGFKQIAAIGKTTEIKPLFAKASVELLSQAYLLATPSITSKPALDPKPK